MANTLEELENDYWGEPNYSTHLVKTCHALRQKPLENFTAEDLRILIGQDIGVKYLLPLAMDMLRKDPLVAGAYYDGDLLCAVLKCKALQSEQYIEFRQELASICTKIIDKEKEAIKKEFWDTMNGHSPEEFGLSSEAVAEIISKADNYEPKKHQSPWYEIACFAKHQRVDQ